jgi:hypothetical protein
MGRILTWCLVAAVAALVVLAGIDTVRGGGERERATATGPEAAATTEPLEPSEDMLAEARADLEAAGIPVGRLTYADEDCRNHVLRLPDLQPESPPSGFVGRCRYRAVVGGLVETRGPTRSLDRSVRIECRPVQLSLLMQVVGPGASELVARGCVAAWMPDGTVTFIRDGEVRRLARCPGDGETAKLRCSKPVLTRADLDRQLRGAPWDGYVLGVKELHWLTNERFAAIMRARSADGPSDYLVIVARGRLLQEPTFAYADLRGIRPSPSGRFVAANDEGRGGLVVVNREGESVQLAMDHGDGVSWSPDEEWIAEATEDGIYVFRADEDSPDFIHIPVVATDLLWE